MNKNPNAARIARLAQIEGTPEMTPRRQDLLNAYRQRGEGLRRTDRDDDLAREASEA